MTDYLVHCATLTLLALLAIACLRSAPARWRLRATFLAVFATTLPWSLLPAIPITVASGPTPVLNILPLSVPAVTSDVGTLTASTMPTETGQFPLLVVLSVASSLGLAAFALLALRQRSTLQRWRAIARDGGQLLGEVPEHLRNCQVCILHAGFQATATGLLRPTVWIGQQHLDDERRASILLHEAMHLHRHHTQIAVALTFLRCLFWWQPFVWLWVWLARRELELDCDEACAEVLGRDRYRTTLASLIHDAVPQPGLALIGHSSFNFRRVKQLEKRRVLSLRHRVATAVALCLAPLLVLDVSVEAQDDDGMTRAELVAMLGDVDGASSAVVTTVDGLIGVQFDTDFVDALRALADHDSRPVYLHPDAATPPRQVRLTAAGTPDEVFRAVSEHVGLASAALPMGVLVAAEPLLSTTDWIDQATTLNAVPNERARLDIDLKIDGQTIATPIDLLVGTSNWTGFEVAGCRFNITARRITEQGVDIELRIPLGSKNNRSTYLKTIPYSRRLPAENPDAGYGHTDLQIRATVVDGKVLDTEGNWHDVELHMAAHKIDLSQDPLIYDEESG